MNAKPKQLRRKVDVRKGAPRRAGKVLKRPVLAQQLDPDAVSKIETEVEQIEAALARLKIPLAALRHQQTAPASAVSTSPAVLTKRDPNTPALLVTGRGAISIKGGTVIGGHTFAKNTPITIPSGLLEPGGDYAVAISQRGRPGIERLSAAPEDKSILGGFHFAPGGNAPERSGGDDIPAINPFSAWDRNYRPACPDPRGMVLFAFPCGKSWGDIYLLNKDHLLNGTSKFGVTIADGNDPPQNPAGSYYKKCDFDTADAVAKHHGKTLFSEEEFYAAAFGVTEKSSASVDPRITGLDKLRTSKWGFMQMTGNLWDWGLPRASLFGGSWFPGGSAGSRCASVGYYWPEDSNGRLGARCRGDHLQLG